ncbi:glycosyltransferase family 2 protein [Microbacterium thalassium]|uniref:glycosyltransferase n=1 Tax=Microbacterium TaxID=33882 RepID=UPI00146EF9D8|nr:glycosyltransferase family 2 protein [Microbacterium thalassium]
MSETASGRRPDIDVVVPVHRADRPLGRAVESALSGARSATVRVTVVCHGIPASAIAPLVEGRQEVRILECADPRPSAAGPANVGFAAATAEYVSRLDSDDTFEAGALDAWHAQARRNRSDVLVAPLRPEDGRPIHAPLTRPFRHRRLDGVRDRLSYRTAPFGLIRRDALPDPAAPYTPGLEVGEDLELGIRLWFGGGRIDFAAGRPAYVVHDDAVQRTTLVVRPVESELAASRRLVRLAWFHELDAAARRAVVIKLARIHVLGALRNRIAGAGFDDADRTSFTTLLDEFDRASASWRRPFNRYDSRILELLRHGDPEAAREAASAPPRRVDTLLAPSMRGTLDRESTLRRYARYLLPV